MRLAHKELGHLGAKKTLKELTRLFVWPGVTMDVKAHVNSCDVCLKHNTSEVTGMPPCVSNLSLVHLNAYL